MKIVINGANRGIGLEFARQYKDRGDEVVALCRKSSPELDGLGVRVIEGVDVSDFDKMKSVASELGESSIDIFIHNAGILKRETLDQMNFDTIEEQFMVNSIGPLKSVVAFLPSIKDGGKIGLMTSRMGSIDDNDSGGRYGYRMSKAALNSAGKSLSIDLMPRKISVAILHPGYVRTDMTDNTGNIDTSESVEGLIKCVDKIDLSATGKFWHYQGHELPW